MLYLGIDVGKFFHSFCLLNEAGEKKVLQIPANKQGFEKLSQLVKKELRDNELLIGMEATGHYFLNIYEFLLRLGVPKDNLVLLNPL